MDEKIALALIAILISLWSVIVSRRSEGHAKRSSAASERSAGASETSARVAESWASIDSRRKCAEVADQVLVAALAVLDDMRASLEVRDDKWKWHGRQETILEAYRCRHLCTVHLPDAEETVHQIALAGQRMMEHQSLWAARADHDVKVNYDIAKVYDEAVNEDRLYPIIEDLRERVITQLRSVATLEDVEPESGH